MGLSQNRCGPSPGADTPHRYRRRRHLRKPSGTFHHLPRFAMSSRGPARDLKCPSQDMAFTAVHPHPTSGSVRGTASRSLKEWAGMRLMPSPPTSTKLEGKACPESLEGERGTKGERVPRLSRICNPPPHHSSPRSGIYPSLPTSTKLEGAVGAGAPTAPSVLLSPSPLKTLRACPESLEALRERGIKGERVPSPPPATTRNPQKSLLGVIQSNQLRVQSMFNQRSIKTPQPNRVPYPFSLSSSCCSDLSSWCCRYATVRSPLVRSTTPRTMSVVRLSPDVIPSGKSIVVSAV